MSEQSNKKRHTRISLALLLVPILAAVPVAGSCSVCVPQAFPSLLSLAIVNVQPPGTGACLGQDAATAGRPLNNAQRWYISFLTQQKVISGQVDELISLFRDNLITPEEFLQRLDGLLSRADRLYSQWKRLKKNGTTDSGVSERVPSETKGRVVYGKEPLAGGADDDVAVGKCLNYLRLSIVNFFLGYSDSNGRQIDDAETQVTLSKVWHSRSMSFIMATEGFPDSAPSEHLGTHPAF